MADTNSGYTDWFNSIVEDLVSSPFIGSKAPTTPEKQLHPEADDFAQAMAELQAGKQKIAINITHFEYVYPDQAGVDPFVDYYLKILYNMNVVKRVDLPDDPANVPDPSQVDITQEIVVKRYSHFRDLHALIRNEWSGRFPALAPRTFVGDSLSRDFIDKRRAQLQRYLNGLLFHNQFWCPSLASFLGLIDQPVKAELPKKSDKAEKADAEESSVILRDESKPVDAKPLTEKQKLQQEKEDSEMFGL